VFEVFLPLAAETEGEETVGGVGSETRGKSSLSWTMSGSCVP